MSGKRLEINCDLIEKYYTTLKKINTLKEELDVLNTLIKEEMDRHGFNRVRVGDYKLKLNAKNKVSDSFIELLKDNGLHQFINENCNVRSFEKACKILDLDKGDRRIYLNKTECKWLYVEKIDR